MLNQCLLAKLYIRGMFITSESRLTGWAHLHVLAKTCQKGKKSQIKNLLHLDVEIRYTVFSAKSDLCFSRWATPSNILLLYLLQGFPGGSVGKESSCNVGDMGLIPGFGRSPGEGNGNPLYYSCLEDSMDRGAWWAQSMGSQRVKHWAHMYMEVNKRILKLIRKKRQEVKI